jgi:hypothetical protein
MANPVLVNRQLQEMQAVMERMRQMQILKEQSMSHLHELAGKINSKGRQIIAAKKKVNGIRAVSKRQQAVHETSNPILVQKLAKITPEA